MKWSLKPDYNIQVGIEGTLSLWEAYYPFRLNEPSTQFPTLSFPEQVEGFSANSLETIRTPFPNTASISMLSPEERERIAPREEEIIPYQLEIGKKYGPFYRLCSKGELATPGVDKTGRYVGKDKPGSQKEGKQIFVPTKGNLCDWLLEFYLKPPAGLPVTPMIFIGREVEKRTWQAFMNNAATLCMVDINWIKLDVG